MASAQGWGYNMDFLQKLDWEQIAVILQWVGLAAIVVVILFLLRSLCRAMGDWMRRRRGSHPVLEQMKKPKELPRGKERILIVDDDPTTLQVNSRMLIGLGYEVVCAHGGEEAIDFVKQIPVDLIVLDLVMDPGIDGVETFRRIRELKPEQRAIVLSGYAQPSQVEAIKRLGVEKYLIKPAPLGTLAQAVRGELDRKK